MRCDRQFPCSNCLRTKNAEACVYYSQPRSASPVRQQRAKEPESMTLPTLNRPINPRPTPSAIHSGNMLSPNNTSHTRSPRTPDTASNPVQEPETTAIEARIGYLEDLVSRISQDPVPPTPKTTSSFYPPNAQSGQSASFLTLDNNIDNKSDNSILHKSRFLGLSHWATALPLVSVK